jgi:hypothetical protein
MPFGHFSNAGLTAVGRLGMVLVVLAFIPVTPYDGVCTAWRGPPELCRYTYGLCLSWSKPEGLGLGLRLRCAFLPGKPRERRALSGPIAYGCSLSGRLMPAVYYV